MESEFIRLASLLEQDGAKRESIGKEVRSDDGEGERRKKKRGRATVSGIRAVTHSLAVGL